MRDFDLSSFFYVVIDGHKQKQLYNFHLVSNSNMPKDGIMCNRKALIKGQGNAVLSVFDQFERVMKNHSRETNQIYLFLRYTIHFVVAAVV